jgi:hypothetical protein
VQIGHCYSMFETKHIKTQFANDFHFMLARRDALPQSISFKLIPQLKY